MNDDAQKPTEASLVTARLREDILSGTVPPGSKIKLVPLAKRYQVSRGPLREAASRLASEGLVHIEDQRGFRAAPVSLQDLRDVTHTRQRVELLALRDAIQHGDLEWEGRVMASCHILERVTDHNGDPDALAAFAEQHRAFHEVLVEACPSQYLLRFRERLYTLTERYRNLAANLYASGTRERNIAEEHQAIAEAAVSRDADLASSLLADHLGTTADVLIEAYPDLFGDDA
jgi:DNA-binding GntR family transcriptional regulator